MRVRWCMTRRALWWIWFRHVGLNRKWSLWWARWSTSRERKSRATAGQGRVWTETGQPVADRLGQ